MSSLIINLFSKPAIEILPPERNEEPGEGASANKCLCCRRHRANMDDDGCGICNECLAP